MFRLFNSVQLVGLFAGMPYLISWLSTNPFPAAPLAYYTTCVGYVVIGIIMTICVFTSVEKLN